MVLTKIFTRISMLILIISVSACSSVAPVKTSIPTEERTQTPQQAQPKEIPVKEAKQVIIRPQEKPKVVKKKTVEIVPVSPATIKKKRQSPAVVALLASAQQASNKGNTRSAQTNLQRAQRIAPQDPDVYYALANIHRDLQDYGLAEQVALKGVSIMQGQAKQLKRFWLLIADIRDESNNTAGAKKARTIARSY